MDVVAKMLRGINWLLHVELQIMLNATRSAWVKDLFRVASLEI